MEMEAAAPPPAKRSRLEAPETRQPENPAPVPAAAAEEVADCESTVKPEESRSQEPPPPPEAGGDGHGDGVDRISGLPDAILGEILSLLSTKEAARTQILASRWRPVWRAAPLVVDANDLAVRGLPSSGMIRAAADEALASAVSFILSAHPGPGRRFCVQPIHLHARPATVDAWLRSPALDNLQELDFLDDGIYVHFHSFEPASPPESTFRFSATLRVATFGKCKFLDSSVAELHFPNLKQLALQYVSISESSLHTMISRCPVLECLLLNQSFGFSCVRISSSSLRSIGVAQRWANQPRLKEIIIADAPCLERLLFLPQCMEFNVSVIAAPKLETCCLSDRCDGFGPFRLMFGTTAIEGLHVVNFTTVMGNVKILAVNSWKINLDMVIDLMKCFPCLEKLYIKCRISGESGNRWRRRHRQFIECFDIRLKTIVLEMYRGIKSHVNFASFFLLNATKLELMTLVVDHTAYNEAFFTEQYAMLQMEKRASRSARLHFTKDRCRHVVHVNHVRGLAITDPFECRG